MTGVTALKWHAGIWLQVNNLAILNRLLTNLAYFYVVNLRKHVFWRSMRLLTKLIGWCILNSYLTFSTSSL
jgi:hypothetical protein